ncbi:MAG: hypothetical protein QOH57_3191, partial [Mycobacterium sp.]|nr:hypothetical protein [Mycobacterium sp.]
MGAASPGESAEVPRHAVGVRGYPGDQFEGGGSLVDGHVPAVERPAPGLSR